MLLEGVDSLLTSAFRSAKKRTRFTQLARCSTSERAIAVRVFPEPVADKQRLSMVVGKVFSDVPDGLF